MPFALWTRQAVQELIECECGVVMPIRSVGEYLKRWGFTPQRPVKRAYEQQPLPVVGKDSRHGVLRLPHP